MANKKFLYHRPNGPAQELEAVKTNPDGTVNLAGADGNLVVTSCEVTAEPSIGSATAIGSPKKGADTASDKAAEEEAAKKAAEEAAKK